MKSIAFRLSTFLLILVTSGCGPSDTELALENDKQKLRIERDSAKRQLRSANIKLEELTLSLKTSQENYDQLEDRVANLKQKKSLTTTSANKLVKKLRGQIKRLESQSSKLKQELLETEAQSSDLHKKLQQIEVKHSVNQEKSDNKDAKLSQLEVEKRALISDIKSIRAEIIRLESASVDSQLTITELQKSNTTLQGQLVSAETENEEQKQRNTALENELTITQKALKSFKDEHKNLSKKVSLTAEQLSSIRSKAAQLNTDYKAMLDKHAQLKKVDSTKQHELNIIRNTLESAQGEVARLTGARGLYTIQENDSLSSIASFFYRDGNRWKNIWQANQHMLPKADLIYEGMVLIVPQIPNPVSAKK